MEYHEFLKKKQKQIEPSGFEIKKEEINNNLFEWQKEIVKWALKKGKCALFEDCGLGKTIQQLAWADEVCKKTKGNVLILAPLAVSNQTKIEGEKFGISVNICESQEDVKNGINITNYEKLDKFDCNTFIGVVLDESSILKSYTGKTKTKIVKAFKNTKYKLACTATPAPNDLMELLNHAEFLGIMKSSEALACWFIADQKRSGKYRLKGYAENDFWKWMSSWAVCIEKPSDIGFSDDGYILPKLNEVNRRLITEKQNGSLDYVTSKIDMSATGFHREKKKTIDIRVAECVKIANEVDGQVIIWCFQNEESTKLKKLLPDSVEISGSDTADKKIKAVDDFIKGNVKILISKPSIFGYGLNFQNCNTSIFCGLDYSFEGYYQAVRRIYRFGQKKEVNIYRVYGDTEEHILNTVQRKADLKEEMNVSMSKQMKENQTNEIKGKQFILNLKTTKIDCPNWLRSEIA